MRRSISRDWHKRSHSADFSVSLYLVSICQSHEILGEWQFPQSTISVFLYTQRDPKLSNANTYMYIYTFMYIYIYLRDASLLIDTFNLSNLFSSFVPDSRWNKCFEVLRDAMKKEKIHVLFFFFFSRTINGILDNFSWKKMIFRVGNFCLTTWERR